jgi:hypothetical protein
MNRTVQLGRGIARPDRIFKAIIKKYKLGSFEFRLDFDAFPRPWFAYCLWHAAQMGHRLGLPKISAIEFGVASGSGLLELEDLAEEIERTVPIKFEIYGFDLGTGLPRHSDYRDLPYVWQRGFYKMDEAALRRKLKRSTLVIGNVQETVPQFLAKYQPAPIGFVSFDMDYYSSTRDAFTLFEGSHRAFLPRVFCYFDDTIGCDEQLHSEHAGELLAIREFNEAHAHQKLSKIHGLASKRPFECGWAESIHVLHRFEHQQYNTYMGTTEANA